MQGEIILDYIENETDEQTKIRIESYLQDEGKGHTFIKLISVTRIVTPSVGIIVPLDDPFDKARYTIEVNTPE